MAGMLKNLASFTLNKWKLTSWLFPSLSLSTQLVGKVSACIAEVLINPAIWLFFFCLLELILLQASIYLACFQNSRGM